jgi:glycine cleavage system H protein
VIEVNHLVRRTINKVAQITPATSSFSSLNLSALVASRMDSPKPKSLHYKRARFATHLPVDFLYSPSHFWLARQAADLWRVGMTQFAARMLGEMVDHGFNVEIGALVNPGQVIGWVEGFKAISDLFSIAEGTFAGGNPVLKEDIALVTKQPYAAGWLYAIHGSPDSKCVDVVGYQALLDKTIDKILEKQATEGDVDEPV